MELGPYRDLTRLAVGGTSEVWRAVHGPSGVEVAVKVLATGGDSLGEELVALARLAHPGIVALLDAGTVPEGCRELPAGAPYLVSELAPSGTLRTAPLRSWAEIHAALGQVLLALAHVHARGVVHLDLKPDNLLRFPLGVVKVADFGIARLVGRQEPSSGVVSGTPGYLSPEQVLGRPLDGRSDLYSLGCVAWRLVCGRTPFRGTDPVAVARMHLSAPLPRLEPRHEVPPGVEAWLRHLLARDLDGRFSCAADAAAVLGLLPTGPRTPVRSDPEPTRVTPGTALPTLSLEVVFGELEAPPRERAPVAPPVDDWRTVEPPPWAQPPVISALNSLRERPMVGRSAERDQLWALLREVRTTGRPGSVLLHGPTGLGKSRLARWLVERAAEIGSAQIVALDDPASMLAVAARSAPRPCVVWIDDVARHRDLPLRSLLGADDVPLLVVMTADDEDGPPPAPESTARIRIGPLSDGDHHELVCGSLGLAPSAGALIEAATGGSPAFAVELVAGWIREGRLVSSPEGLVLQGDAVGRRLPDRLADVHRASVAGLAGLLGDHDLQAIEIAAALGDTFDDREWKEIAEPTPAAARSAVEQRILWRPSGVLTWSFASRTVRECWLAAAEGANRLAGHHAAIARRLAERGPSPDRLGIHLACAGRTSDAVGPLLAGAQEALRRERYGRALELLDLREPLLDELRVPSDHPQRLEGWLVRARAHRGRGDADLARAVATELAAVAEATAQVALQGHAELLIGLVGWRTLTTEALERQFRTAAATLRAAGEEQHALYADSQLAVALLALQRESEASEIVERGLTRASDPRARMALLRQRGEAAFRRAAWAEAIGWWREALERVAEMDAPRHPEAMIRMDLCRGALNVGDLALAAAEARAARELCRALGSRRGVMECDQLLALVPFHAQRWSEAADRLRTLLERVGATELDLQATVCMNLAAALAGAGRFDEALAVTDRGSRVSAELGIASYVSLGVVRRYLLAGGPTPEAGAIRELTDDEHSWREAAIRYGRPDIVERIDLVLAAAGSRG